MLTHIVALGFAVFFLVHLVRALPRVYGWVIVGKKPWACDLCMSFWAALIITVALHGWAFWDAFTGAISPHDLWLAVKTLRPFDVCASAGVSIALLRLERPPPLEPPF